jgi:hypothetical protein
MSAVRTLDPTQLGYACPLFGTLQRLGDAQPLGTVSALGQP